MTWQRADEVLCARRCVGIACVLIVAPARPWVLPGAPCLAGARTPQKPISEWDLKMGFMITMNVFHGHKARK